MKKLLFISAIAMSGLFYNTANAQIRLHVGVHFGGAPIVVSEQAPVVYDDQPVAYNDNNDDYYYLPDVDAYYNVGQQCYYYNDGGSWVSAAYLPGAYRDYDWRSCRRYEVRAPRPYMHADFYRNRFNGVAFNGRWDNRAYDRGYVTAYHSNRDFNYGGYGDRRVDDRRFEDRRFDHGWRNDNRHYDRGRDNRDWNDRHER